MFQGISELRIHFLIDNQKHHYLPSGSLTYIVEIEPVSYTKRFCEKVTTVKSVI